MAGIFYIVGTPIGNLGDMSTRVIETLKSVDAIYCEDTRRTLKLLNHLAIKKPLLSCPQFKEKKEFDKIRERLTQKQSIAYCSDAGMPGIQDPGQYLVKEVREAGFKVEVIDGPSAITHFLAGLGFRFEAFRFVGFLPPRKKDRTDFFSQDFKELTIFFESPHRIQATLELLVESQRDLQLALGKEFTKISEAFFFGKAGGLIKEIPSFKGEWVGAIFPEEKTKP